MTAELVRYDAMCHAIAECHSVDEVSEIRNKARALEVYAKQAMNVESERKAREVRLRAERRTGELLADLKRATPIERGTKGAAVQGKQVRPTVGETSPYAEALDRTGISTQSASRYQALAKVPSAEFEGALNSELPATTNSILRAANGATRMDDASLWLWGRLRDSERDGLLDRNPAEIFGGMTNSMQDDVRRILPVLMNWLNNLEELTT